MNKQDTFGYVFSAGAYNPITGQLYDSAGDNATTNHNSSQGNVNRSRGIAQPFLSKLIAQTNLNSTLDSPSLKFFVPHFRSSPQMKLT